jgi:hypothetical protein
MTSRERHPINLSIAGKSVPLRGQIFLDLMSSIIIFVIFFTVIGFLLARLESDQKEFRVKISYPSSKELNPLPYPSLK